MKEASLLGCFFDSWVKMTLKRFITTQEEYMTKLYAHDGGGDSFYVNKKEVTTHLDLIHYLLSRQ